MCLVSFDIIREGQADSLDAVPEFISQRRRWLNGAFFAAVYSLVHFRQIWVTDHTLMRKILLHIEFVYQFVSLAFTYFSLVTMNPPIAPFCSDSDCEGELLSHILFHRWLTGRSQTRSVRAQYWIVYLCHTSLRLCATDMQSIYSIYGESSTRVRDPN